MEEEDNYSPLKRAKRSRTEIDEFEDHVDNRVCVIQQLKQNNEELVSDEKYSSDYYCRKGPSLSENPISNILKVVSLQSFTSSRLVQASEGLNGQQTPRDFGCRLNSFHSPPSRSNGESSPSSDDSGNCFRVTCETPSRNTLRKSSSRAKKGEKAGLTPKDDKYWEKRVRNNASAKRSRDARRVRELECQIRSEYMEDENRKLEHDNRILKEENKKLLKIIEELKSRK